MSTDVHLSAIDARFCGGFSGAARRQAAIGVPGGVGAAPEKTTAGMTCRHPGRTRKVQRNPLHERPIDYSYFTLL
jgi:hypothetical protein